MNFIEQQQDCDEMIITNRVCQLSVNNNQSPATLEDLFGKVLVSGFITSTDRQRIKTVLLNETISEEHHAIINRLLYGVRRGFLKMGT